MESESIINQLTVKACSHCKTEKPVGEFHANKSKADGLSSLCRACQNLASKKYYQKNVGKMRERNNLTNQKRRESLRRLKSNPCSDCGQTFPFYVMEFDHREPVQKEFNIADSIKKSRDSFNRELQKCDLVCSNCHRIRTFTRKAEGLGVEA